MTKPVAFASCLCLLLLQWSGLHVHASEAGYVGGPETASTHSHARHDHLDAQHSQHHETTSANTSGGHDYGDVRDVSLVDQALVAFKLPLAILALVFLFAVFPLVRIFAGREIAYPVLSGRYTRWRPPLRAPPQSA